MKTQTIYPKERELLVNAYEDVRTSETARTNDACPLYMRPIYITKCDDSVCVECDEVEYMFPLSTSGKNAVDELVQLGALTLVYKEVPDSNQPAFHAPIAVLALADVAYRGVVLKVTDKTIFVYTKKGLFVFNKNTGEARPHLSITECDVRLYQLENLDVIRTYLQDQGRWETTKVSELPKPGEDLVAWCEKHNVVAVSLATE